jgi:hypothetical protein
MLIGLCGGKGHGKGTACKFLVDRHNFIEINFADPLKKVCATAFGIPLRAFIDPELKEQPLDAAGYPNETPRTLMQAVGTDLFRAKWPGVWVDTWKRTVSLYPRVVVSDVRFPSELAALRDLQGVLVRVNNPRVSQTDAHASESHYNGFDPDADIVNDKDAKALMLAVEAFAVKQFKL